MTGLLHGLCAALAVAAPVATTPEIDPLPPAWKADGGIPVALGDGSTLFLFGDTVVDDGRMVHNSATILRDGELQALWHPQGLLRDGTDTWFWPSDAVVRPTGELVVVANEVERDMSNWFGFSTVDTDVFVVSDPSNVMSWRLAEHVDEGWWDGHNVAFVDQQPWRALVRPLGEDVTYSIDTRQPDLPPELVFDYGSDGLFQPVQHAGVWFGVSWDMGARTWTLWRFGGDWTEVKTTEFDNVQYGHALHVIDGRVVLKWSNGDGTQRVEYHDVTELLTG